MIRQALSVDGRDYFALNQQVVWCPNFRASVVGRSSAWLAFGALSIAGAATLGGGSMAWAQGTSALAPEIEQGMELLRQVHEGMPEAVRARLSGSALNLEQVVADWDKIRSGLERAAEVKGGFAAQALDAERDSAPATLGDDSESFDIKLVSDPDAIEDHLSALAGFTQSETDTAKCDDTLVIGFNDSGSFVQTVVGGVSPSGSLSFNGWSRSDDSDDTFDDRGILLADPLPAGVMFRDLFGDPLIECADANTFYYGSLAADISDDFFTVLSGISVSKSTDGGRSFGGAVMAVSKDGFEHFLDKPWMAVNPTHLETIYVTYTDFDFSFSSAACGEDIRTAIELVVSEDGGQTWTDPLVLAEVCGSDFVQGSQVVVGPSGEVYVAWEDFKDDLVGPRRLLIRRSDDGGASFQPIRKVSDVTPVGDGFFLNRFFRAAFEFPSMAVDRSKLATRGNVYVAWSDGRRAVVPDPIAFLGTYGFADVLISRSMDGGETWSAPSLVNDDSPETKETDQYQPALAVDRRGTIGACFYDRRENLQNVTIDRFCATSDDAGKTWDNRRVTGNSFAPVPSQDVLVSLFYMGDYDTLASDFTGLDSGFFGAWGDNTANNPDVRGALISRELLLAKGQ